MKDTEPTADGGDRQAGIRAFVTRLAESGGYEEYWIRLHGDSLNRAEKATVLRHSRPPGPNAIVLDAGCGEGRLTLGLAEMYGHVHALDFSATSCERLRQAAQARGIRNITARCHDLLRPIDVRHVNTVILVQVLQHFENESDRIRVLRNLLDCLDVGGRIVLTVFNYDRLVNRLRGMSPDVSKTDGYPYFHYFRITELRGLLSAAGFAKIRVRGCINIPAFIHQPLQGSLASSADAIVSDFAPSRYLGIYLLATAAKSAASTE